MQPAGEAGDGRLVFLDEVGCLLFWFCNVGKLGWRGDVSCCYLVIHDEVG